MFCSQSRTSLVHSACLVVFICLLSSSWAFPDQFELNSFLLNAPPKSFEAEFFNPRVRKNIGEDFKYGGVANSQAGAPTHNGVLVSQNHKYLAKTPEHDKHFRAILLQQEAATIKDPGQAAMVASDQMELRGRLRHSLQTSDDDVYEVESAPVMRSTPYRSARNERYRNTRVIPEDDEQQQEEGAGPVELPVSVNFESNIDHSYEPKQQQAEQQPRRHRATSYANQMPMKFVDSDGEPNEPTDSNYYRPQSEAYSRQYPPVQENVHFSLGAVNTEDDDNSVSQQYQRPPERPNRIRQETSGHRAKSSPGEATSYHHTPYQQVQYSQIDPTDNYQEEVKPRYYRQTESEYRGPGNYVVSSPAARQQQHERDQLYASQPVPKYGKNQEQAWLDMGAYSSGKGAFGWYSDVPVGGTNRRQAQKKK